MVDSFVKPRFWLEGAGLASGFADFLGARSARMGNVREEVATILAELREKGDAVLLSAAKQFDGVSLSEGELLLAKEAWREAAGQCQQEDKSALELAARRIAAFHEAQGPEDKEFTDEAGVRQGWRWRAVESAGLYVPGGSAAYPSSLLMNAIPAKIAGVERILAATPAQASGLNPVLMAAAELAGIEQILQAGGAFAIGALAYGTAQVKPVAVITGPGNQWVAEAKRQVYGQAGIDMIAGPSEILVIASGANRADWIAADLLSQAEHDEEAQSILLTDDADFARAVLAEMEQQLRGLARAEAAAASWRNQGAVIIASMGEAGALASQIAAEHVELAVPNPDALAGEITHAGALFYGPYTAEAVGDYVGGPNHVLPTGGAARFSSGLAVTNFMVRTSFLEVSREGLAAIGPAAVRLAEAEGFGAHALAVKLRLEKNRAD